MRNLVQIIIPVYKEKLSCFERIALQQVTKILYKYPIAFVASESLEFDYGNEYKNFCIERFSDKYFNDIKSYNTLMLSQEFYQRFLQYKNILIYQLDAFVFKDELVKFCRLGYDYIGAPWLNGMKYKFDNKEYKSFVGNGGFSLRNVEASLRVLRNQKDVCKHWMENEDLFFSYCADKKIEGFTTPPIGKALSFAFEMNVQKCYKKNKKVLPFGCHAWEKYDIEFFKLIFQNYGYHIDQVDNEFGKEDQKNREIRLEELVYYRNKRNKNINYIIDTIQTLFKNGDNSYAVFGTGRDGYECYLKLKEENIKIETFFDNAIKKQGTLLENISIKNPSELSNRKNSLKIIIATRKYEDAISEQLKAYGLTYKVDFVTFSEVEKIATQNYIKKFVNQNKF